MNKTLFNNLYNALLMQTEAVKDFTVVATKLYGSKKKRKTKGKSKRWNRSTF